MNIQATGPGKTGSINDGIGKLVISKAEGFETKQLLLLYQAISIGDLAVQFGE